MTEDGGAFGKGYIEAELDIHPDLPFLVVTLLVTQLCQDA